MEKPKKQKEAMPNKAPLSTELFKNKNIPPFLKDHTLFKTPTNPPTRVQKVFRSIGLPNFSEKVSIEKSFDNLKKEGSYVFNLLSTMCAGLTAARDMSNNLADQIQFLSPKEEREANRNKISELYSMSSILNTLIGYVDPYNCLDTIQNIEGKIVLKLPVNIPDGKGKNLFRKDEPLFRIFSALKERCGELGVQFVNLEQTPQFKVFSKENMPNKEYSVVFSSEGEEGAWDIATMSMRGIKSCQRWDGEYPRCLIGSILSKFVGVIYLTSGIKAEDHPAYTNLGTKMIRRCVIRYAIDADESAPCILIDKMYPEYDKEVCAIFTKCLQSKTKLPVHYAPELGNKTKHIYLPTEKIRDQVSNRDWSYQDTPLKSKHDLNVYYLLNNNKEEIERDIKGFKSNLPLFVARKMEDVYSDNLIVDDEVKKTVKNIRMNTAFTPFCETICSTMMNLMPQTSSKNFTDSKSFYRKYLMDLLMFRKKVFPTVVLNIKGTIAASTSRTVDYEAFTKFLYAMLAEFVKSEMTKIIN